MSTKPNHRRGHGRIQQAGCRTPGCWVCRIGPALNAERKERAAMRDEREQRADVGRDR